MPNKANLHTRKPHKRVLKGLSGGVICQTLVERCQKKCLYTHNYKFYHAKEKYYKTYYAGSFNEEQHGFLHSFRFTLHLLYIISRSTPMLASMNLLIYLCGIALKTVL